MIFFFTLLIHFVIIVCLSVYLCIPLSSSQDSNIHGVQAIMDHVAQLQLAGSRVDLTNGLIDAQQSEYDCVIVCVNGQITFPSSPASQAFVQSFVLAPQQVNANDTKSHTSYETQSFALLVQ